MKGIAVLLALFFSLSTTVNGQTADCLKAADAPQETFEVKGIANDDKGPLAKLTVIAFPFILPDNRPVTRFWLQDVILVKDAGRGHEFIYKTKNEGALAMANPRTQTDDVGAFTLQVPKGLFMVPCNCKGCRKYKPGELAIGIFVEGAGKWSSTRELIPVKVDVANAMNDVGELTFKPAGPD
jgi:hypothetical protein